jgi:hypothetical protein
MHGEAQGAHRLEGTLSALSLSVLLSLPVACTDKVAEPEPPPKPTTTTSSSAPADPTELVKEDLKPGTGDRAVKDGDAIKVHYVGKLLKNGVKFDSNEAKDKPFEFTVGEGVIEGWSKGVVGMKKGGKRKLVIPAPLAYGESGHPPKIPANSALTFEIELVGWADEPDAAASASPSGSADAKPAGSGSAAPAAGSAAPKAEPAKGDAPKPTATAKPKANP